MLQTLSGRLRRECTDEGIILVIPARMSWGVIRKLVEDVCVSLVAFLLIAVIAGCVAFVRGLDSRSFLQSKGIHSLLIGAIGYCSGLILIRMIAALFGKTILRLNPSQNVLEVNWSFKRSKAVYPSATAHSFRFVERLGAVPIMNDIGQNEIQFAHDRATQHFGEGVTRAEAAALISEVNKVFPSTV